MAMIVTTALGFLLEPLPRVRLSSSMHGGRIQNLSVMLRTKLSHNCILCIYVLFLYLTPVCPGCLGHHQPEGHADAVQRNRVLVEEGQTRLCM